MHGSAVERCCTDDRKVRCMVALLKDAVLRQRDDVHVSTLERCRTETAI